MAIAETVQAQRDFSAGEVDVTVKRDEDSDVFKRGLRQCTNVRILDTKKLQQRQGRTIKFIDGPRVEEIILGAGSGYRLVFSNATLTVRDNVTGAVLFTAGSQPWSAATVNKISFDVSGSSVYICYLLTPPQILTLTGASWSLTAFTFTGLSTGGIAAPFYRIAGPGVLINVSALTGTITITATSAYFVVGMVGTVIRYNGRQIQITAVASPTSATGLVLETLYATISHTLTSVNGFFYAGDVVEDTDGNKGVVASFSGPSGPLVVSFLTQSGFTGADTVVGPFGSAVINVGSPASPAATAIWDEQAIGNYYGWPGFVFVDQNRLGFCDIVSVPNGILWSEESVLNNFYVGANPTDAIFELAPGKTHVLYVVPGVESSEFVFGDNAIYYIQITQANPLTPSNVSFQRIAGEGSAAVQPRLVQEAIVYVAAGAGSMRAITATGAYQRPYEIRPISKFHDHLINAPVAIAAPAASDPNFPERYIYVLNGDGSLAVGKLLIEDGIVKEPPGWVRWNGAGTVLWVSARITNVWFGTSYAYPGGSVTVAELLDATQYLDVALPYNAAPAALAPPGGKGPLWWLPGGTCEVMDNSTRQLGDYVIDANGFLIPQFEGGENLASVNLAVGQKWTLVVEPFVPSPGPGQDAKQRMTKRRVARLAVYFINSTGFLMARLFSGPITQTSPPLGTVVNQRRVPTYNMGDDATQPPPLRESVERWRPSGRSYDPRVAIIKDTAGPLIIAEIGMEVTV